VLQSKRVLDVFGTRVQAHDLRVDSGRQGGSRWRDHAVRHSEREKGRSIPEAALCQAEIVGRRVLSDESRLRQRFTPATRPEPARLPASLRRLWTAS